MKRIIVDFNKLTDELKSMFIEKYPEGYSANDLISFNNLKGETINAIELNTDEAVYLIKINKSAEQELDSVTDEAYDYFLAAKQNDSDLSMNGEDHEDIGEMEEEPEDDSDDFFDELDN